MVSQRREEEEASHVAAESDVEWGTHAQLGLSFLFSPRVAQKGVLPTFTVAFSAQ